jgi:hypothetical protein
MWIGFPPEAETSSLDGSFGEASLQPSLERPKSLTTKMLEDLAIKAKAG